MELLEPPVMAKMVTINTTKLVTACEIDSKSAKYYPENENLDAYIGLIEKTLDSYVMTKMASLTII